MPPFWTPLRAPFWTPRQAETGLLGGLGPSKSRFQLLFLGPEGSRSAPRGQLEVKIRPPQKEPYPGGLQDGSKSVPRHILRLFWGAFWSHPGMTLEQFGAQLGSCFCILFSFKQAADAREIRSIAISITSSKRPSARAARVRVPRRAC